jgi:hypothetical protein
MSYEIVLYSATYKFGLILYFIEYNSYLCGDETIVFHILQAFGAYKG